MAMLPRTERQTQVLTFIESYVLKRGSAPSYQTIARFLGVKSSATVHKHVAALERRGLIKREGHSHDGTFNLSVTSNAMQCPKCNHVFLRESQDGGKGS